VQLRAMQDCRMRMEATPAHFVQPSKERIVREVGYGMSLEGIARRADLAKSVQAVPIV